MGWFDGYFSGNTDAEKRKIRSHNRMMSVIKEKGFQEAISRGYPEDKVMKQWNRLVKARKNGWKGFCPSIPIKEVADK